MNEGFIKITFRSDGIQVEGQKLSQSDILCAILALIGEFDKDSIQPAVELLRKMKKAMTKNNEEKKD